MIWNDFPLNNVTDAIVKGSNDHTFFLDGFAAYFAKQVSLPVSFAKQIHRLSCSKNGFDSRINKNRWIKSC